MKSPTLLLALLISFLLSHVASSLAFYTSMKRRVDDSIFQLQLTSDISNTPSSSAVPNNPLLQAIHQGSEIISNNNSDTEARRIFHGRGGSYPGWEHVTLDWYPPVFLLTSHNQKLSGETVASVHSHMEKFSTDTGEDAINFVYQYRNDTGFESEIISGSVPRPKHVITENGMKFVVNLLSGKNHGIFLDMANGRTWAREQSHEANVLNLFSYTCGFSVAALSGGARQVVNIDMAAGPMKNGKRNHELNNIKEGARFLTHNIFKTWGKIRKLGPYDLIIVDPPSFQKNSFIAKKDYNKILRRLVDLLTENGKVLLCLNAPELDTTWLKEQVAMEAPELEFIERLQNLDSFPELYPEKALKVMVFQKKQS